MNKKRWTEEEKLELNRVVGSGWDWSFPGWKWVAVTLYNRMKEDSSRYRKRTPEACRAMCKKLKI